MYVQADHSGAVADRAAQLPGIVGEVAGFEAQFLCILCPGKYFPQLVVHIGVSGDGGADIDADGRGVDKLHLTDAFCFHGEDVLRQFLSVDRSLQTGDQTFQDESRLAGAGHAGDHGQLSLWNLCIQGLHGMDRSG